MPLFQNETLTVLLTKEVKLKSNQRGDPKDGAMKAGVTLAPMEG